MTPASHTSVILTRTVSQRTCKSIFFYLGRLDRFVRRSFMQRTRAACLLLSTLLVLLWALTSIAGAPGQSRAAKRTDGLAAWGQVYTVLTHPRCINCHTATNYPQQGDDRHRHFANVVRGPEGHGVPALNCVTCHQQSNADSTGVPGGHDWHLAPLSMRWQDENDQPLSSAAVCRSVSDRSKNGNLDGRGLLKHHEE